MLDIIYSENLKSQSYLDILNKWTDDKEIKLNAQKSKYMVFIFSRNYQFSTRLSINGNILEKVRSTRLLGLVLNDDRKYINNCQKCIQMNGDPKKPLKFQHANYRVA